MIRSIGLLEVSSIGRGVAAADAMLKAAAVELLEARPICPGKYVILVAGDVAAVESAVGAGREIAADAVIDDFLLPNVHPSVISAVGGTASIGEIRALGIIETFSAASLFVAADAAAKAGDVALIEIRIGMGIGGKSFVTLTGDVSAVNSSVEAGAAVAGERGMLVEKIVIPSPHSQLKQCVF